MTDTTPPFLAALLAADATALLHRLTIPAERCDVPPGTAACRAVRDDRTRDLGFDPGAVTLLAGDAPPGTGLRWHAELRFSLPGRELVLHAFVPEPGEALLDNLLGKPRVGFTDQASPALQSFFGELARATARRWAGWLGGKVAGQLVRVRLIDLARFPAVAAVRLDFSLRAGGLAVPGGCFLLSPRALQTLLEAVLAIPVADPNELLALARDPGESVYRRDQPQPLDIYALLATRTPAENQLLLTALLQGGLSTEALGVLWWAGTEAERQRVTAALSRSNRDALENWVGAHREQLAKLGSNSAREEAKMKCRPLLARLARDGKLDGVQPDRFAAIREAWERVRLEQYLAGYDFNRWAARLIPFERTELLRALTLMPDRVLDTVFSGVSAAGRERLRQDRDHLRRTVPYLELLTALRQVVQGVEAEIADEPFQRRTKAVLERYLAALNDPAAIFEVYRREPRFSEAVADLSPATRHKLAQALPERMRAEFIGGQAAAKQCDARTRAQARYRLILAIEEMIENGDLVLTRREPYWVE